MYTCILIWGGVGTALFSLTALRKHLTWQWVSRSPSFRLLPIIPFTSNHLVFSFAPRRLTIFWTDQKQLQLRTNNEVLPQRPANGHPAFEHAQVCRCCIQPSKHYCCFYWPKRSSERTCKSNFVEYNCAVQSYVWWYSVLSWSILMMQRKIVAFPSTIAAFCIRTTPWHPYHTYYWRPCCCSQRRRTTNTSQYNTLPHYAYDLIRFIPYYYRTPCRCSHDFP